MARARVRGTGGRITEVESRARIDTAHEALRQRMNRSETAALFAARHGVGSHATLNEWLRRARAELAEDMARDKSEQIALSRATLDAVISMAFKSRELRTVVAAQAELNKVLLHSTESADAKLAAGAAGANAAAYAEMLQRVTATPAEVAQRMKSIEAAQDAIVEKRLPYVVNAKDRVSDNGAGSNGSNGSNGNGSHK